MTIEELLCLGQKTIHKDESRLILATLLNKNPLELSLHLNEEIDLDIVEKYKECLKNLKKGIPLQYALKETNFHGINFYVDNRVLIPRFETEELVNYTNNYIKKYFSKKIKILDLCTGSGCCGLVLKKFNLESKVTLADISKEALEVAKINGERLNLDVTYKESDLFSNIKEKYDVLISNPPYVSKDDEVSELVLKNEPHIALYAKKSGLEFYEKILKYCEFYLKDKYIIAFEIGSTQKEAILNLIKIYLKNVNTITKKDMAGKDRFIFIFKNINLDE